MSILNTDFLLASPPVSNARELSPGDSGDRLFRDQLQRAAGGQTDPQKTEPGESAGKSKTPIQETRSQDNDAEQESSHAAVDPYETNESTPPLEAEIEPTDALPTGDQIEVSVAAVAVLEAQDLQTSPTSSQDQEAAQEVQGTSDQGATSEDELPAPIPTETALLNQTDERGSNGGKKSLIDTAVALETEADAASQSASEKPLDASLAQTEGLQTPSANKKQEPGRSETAGELQENERRIPSSQAPLSSSEPAQLEPETSDKQNRTPEKTSGEFSLASTATSAENEIVERIAPAGQESSLPANASENDVLQRPTTPDSIRTLERFLGNRSVRTDSTASQSEPTTTVDRARFVQRVGNALRTANQQEGHVQLRLSPPELGSLKIDISVRQGVLTARLEAETVAARTVLLDNLPALRERLAEQEIRIEQFDVEVRRDGQQQPEDRSTDSQRPDHRSSDSRSQQSDKTIDEEPETLDGFPAGVSSAITSEGLDVRI